MSTSRWSLWVITVLSATVFCATLVHALWFAPEIDSYAPAAAAAIHESTAPEDQPARLLIPTLGIDTTVQYVGLNAKGQMGVPSNFTDVAWYKFGTVPGNRGSAVIDGHVDNGLGLSGVFKHLADLQTGDDVYVQRKSGEKLHFVVTSVAIYPYKEVPAALVFDRADVSRLNLITCDGKWVKGDKTYDERLVVYTELVDS